MAKHDDWRGDTGITSYPSKITFGTSKPDILEVASMWLQNPTEEESIGLVEELYNELYRARTKLNAFIALADSD